MGNPVISCPNCETENHSTAQFCTYCGLWLQNFDTQKTFSGQQGTAFKAHIEEIVQSIEMAEVQAPTLEKGTVALVPVNMDSLIKLQFEDVIILGRDTGERSHDKPLVDFNDYRGYMMGVSRQHAQITGNQTDGYMITDLDSSNGTYLNGERLKPNTPTPLKNTDQVLLGQLELRFYYK